METAAVGKGELITQVPATRCQLVPLTCSSTGQTSGHGVTVQLRVKASWAASPSSPWPSRPQALASLPPKHLQNLSEALPLRGHRPGRLTTTPSLLAACSSFSRSACTYPCPLLSILHPTARGNSKCKSNGPLSCCKPAGKGVPSLAPHPAPATLTTAQPQ